MTPHKYHVVSNHTNELFVQHLVKADMKQNKKAWLLDFVKADHR